MDLINYLKTEYDSIILEVVHHNGELVFHIESSENAQTLEEILNEKVQLNLPIRVDIKEKGRKKTELSKSFILNLLKNEEKYGTCCASLNEEDIKLTEDNIKIYFSHSCFSDNFLSKNQKNPLEKEIEKWTCEKYNIEILEKPLNNDQYQNHLHQQEEDFLQEIKSKAQEKPKTVQNKDEVTEVNYGKKIEEKPIPMDQLSLDEQFVTVQGEILEYDYFSYAEGTKKGIKFTLADDVSALACTWFLSNEKFDELYPLLREEKVLKVKGRLNYDNRWQHGFILTVNQVEEKVKNYRQDHYPQKRVELHLYSQMSQVEGFVNLEELFKTLKRWGHTAVGITDRSVVQAYPEFYDLAIKYGIKGLLGMEGWLLEDYAPIFMDYGHRDFNEFVVFDIETTGFSRYKDKITEIGAVKVRNGQIVDSFNELINPECLIPEEVVELTGITNEMVSDKPLIGEILPKFKEFIGDAILVAHNASFDIGFLTENYFRENIPFKPSYVDTLAFSRVLYPEESRHSLDRVARRLGVQLLDHHRADQDAQATAEIFVKFLEMIEERDSTFDENINKLETDYPKSKNKGYNFTLYAKNKNGLKNLYELVSLSSLEYVDLRAGIPRKDLERFREDLILGTGNIYGEFFQGVLNHEEDERLKEILKEYDFIEIQPISVYKSEILKGELPEYNEFIKLHQRIIDLADDVDLPVIVTGDVKYIEARDYIHRNIILESQVGRRTVFPEIVGTKYLRTTDEMMDEFYYLSEEKRKEIIIENSNHLADSIEEIRPIPTGMYVPKIEGADEDLKRICYEEAEKIYGAPLPKPIKSRLDHELDSIISNGFGVLYMIARDLVKESEKNGYLVGSRGSVGSSFAATMAGITEVNPLKAHYICRNPECKYLLFSEDDYLGSGADLEDNNCPECNTNLLKEGHNIPFEVFLGFEGDKVPDIDLNFASEYQPKIHDFTEEYFGRDKVYRAGTIGVIQENTAFGYIKKYAEVHDKHFDNANILKLQKGMIGVKRTSGQHPGGMMIVPKNKDITDFTPVQRPADDMDSKISTTHFTYKAIEDNILKLDLLGHDVPSIIRMLEDYTNTNSLDIPLNDPDTLSIFNSIDSLNLSKDYDANLVGTLGIPEFGTGFVRQMLVETKPESFSDLVRISGLSHGTDVWKNNAQDLINQNIITLSDAISTRDDIMTYLISKNVESNDAFNIMENVRKGRFTSHPKYHYYIEEMEKNNVPDWYIKSLETIQYMFPKAHAVAYVLMSFRIAYYKVHYPAAFYASYFTTRIQDYPDVFIDEGIFSVRDELRRIENLGYDATPKETVTYQVLEVAEEMLDRGIEIVSPNFENSKALEFTMLNDKTILAPLRALSGVSDAHALNIVKELKNGKFLSIEDLRKRTGVNKNAIESLQNFGVLEGLGDTNQISIL